jgi:translation initiation factor 2D
MGHPAPRIKESAPGAAPELGSEPGAGAVGDAAGAANPPEEMDELLLRGLLQALVTSVKDVMLPLPAGTLWNAHLLPCRPAGSHLDLKHSGHKKLAKFLQAYGQAGAKLMQLREDKHSNETIITRIDRRHPLLMSFTPHQVIKQVYLPVCLMQRALVLMPPSPGLLLSD